MEHVGRVIRKRVAPESKSDRIAVVLKTRDHEFVLRRLGGNPFRDEQLEQLVGHKVSATGNITGNTLIMSNWQVVD